MKNIRQTILAQATKRKGLPYRLDPPPDGVNNCDCSLFIKLTFADADVPFAASVRTAEQIRQACTPIGWDDVNLGDLVFFQNTYDAPGPAGPDGRIASHAGISLGAGTRRMWDCHATEESGPPGVGETDISTDFWQSHLFEARRAPQVDSFTEPTGETGMTRFRVTENGVRLRAAAGTSQTILIPSLAAGTIVEALDDQVTSADGHNWRHVLAAGQRGYIAAEFLELADAGSIGELIHTEFGDAPADLSAAIRRNFPADQWVNAARIAHVESGWNRTALADTVSRIGPCGTPYTLPDGRHALSEIARGYFQINGCAHPQWDNDDIYAADANTAAAAQLFADSGWQPWLFSATSLGLL